MPKLNPKEIDEFLDDIRREYGVPREIIIDELEMSANAILSVVTGYNVESRVYTDTKMGGTLKAWGCIGDWRTTPYVKEFTPDSISKSAVRLIAHDISKRMRNINIYNHYNALHRIRNKVLSGRVTHSHPTMNIYYVEIEFPMLGNPEFSDYVTAAYPRKHQPMHEIGNIRIGESRKFYINRVTLLRPPNGYDRVTIIASRRSARFPEVLLKNKCDQLSDTCRLIKCVKRVSGQATTIMTTHPIPKTILMDVQAEIGEYLYIKFPRKYEYTGQARSSAVEAGAF